MSIRCLIGVTLHAGICHCAQVFDDFQLRGNGDVPDVLSLLVIIDAELASGIRGDSPFLPLFWKIVIAFMPTQLPLGILEGAITSGMVVLLYKKRPDLLVKMGVV